ncbi:MAG: hypothetical protein HY518_05300, partial [Candidatus Aenigmarchaeota archaeon]|nr:hypothetical protein [Candidatus Aenigmarchaeota archaeon]
NYFFNPSCSYSAAVQVWKAGITDANYNNTNSTNLTVTVTGDLILNITLPNGQEFLRGANITFNGSARDDCSNPGTSATVAINFTQDSQTFACTPVDELANGNYSCVYNTSALPARYYNVTLQAIKTNRNTNSTTKTNGFFIETVPLVKNQSVTSSGDGGWGETWTFRANVTDEDQDNIWVYLWINKSTGLVLSGQNTTVVGNNISIEFVPSNPFSGNDIGTRQFLFNATDQTYEYNFPPENFVIDKDNVTAVHIIGNNTQVNRTNPVINWTVRFIDIDRQPNVSIGSGRTGKFWYTNNSVTVLVSEQKFTSDGQITLTNSDVGVDCSFTVGPQSWLSGTTGNGFYKDQNSTLFNWTIITNPLTANVTAPDGTNIRQGIDNILIRGRVTDDCSGVAGATVTFRVPSQNFDCSGVNDEGNGFYNCTIAAASHSSWSPGTYSIEMNATKIHYNSTTTTKTNAFSIATEPDLTLPTATSEEGTSTGGWGENWNFSVRVQDVDGDNVTVSLWINLTGAFERKNSTNLTAVSATTVRFDNIQFNSSNIGSRVFLFNVTDTRVYNDTINSTMTIEEDDVTIDFIAGAGGTIGREGTNITTLQLQITDDDRSVVVGSGVNGSFFITTDGTNFDSGNPNVTDSSGIITLYFNPTCTYLAGSQSWKGGVDNDDRYTDENSSTFSKTIIGQLKNNIQMPAFNSSTPVGNPLLIVTNASTDCNELQNSTSITYELRSPSNVTESCTPVNDVGNGTYNCTWSTTLHQGGYWDTIINASKTNYNRNDSVFRRWIFLNNTPPVTENFSLSPSIEGWGVIYRYKVDLNDLQQDNVTCDLFISTNGGSTYTKRNSTNVTGGIGGCNLTISNFACGDIGSDNQFLFQLYDGTNLFNTSTQSGPTITEDNVTITYLIGNATITNRSNTQNTIFTVRVNDTDKNVTPSDANVTFWVTTNGLAFDAGTVNQTNATGYGNYYFNPDCTYAVGVQQWRTGVVDACYTDVNITQNFTTTIFGDFINDILAFSDFTILRTNQTVTIDSEVKSDCSVGLEGATVNYTFRHITTNTTFSCTSVTDLTGGFYRCTRNTTAMNAGNYTSITNTTLSYYYNASHNETNTFFIETAPVILNTSVSPNTGGWGERFNFTANLSDEDGDNVTLELYVALVGSSYGAAVNSTILQGPVLNRSASLSYVVSFCSTGTWRYRFRAVDDANTPIPLETQYTIYSEDKNFTVERDDVRIELTHGNGTTFWRNGTDFIFLGLLTTDNDTNSTLGSGRNASFWITTNGSFFAGAKSTQTNSSSHINYNFTADLPPGQTECNFEAGIHTWIGGIAGDTCYKDSNSSPYVFTMRSELRPSIVHPNGEGFLQGQTIMINGTVGDDCSLVENATISYTLTPESAPSLAFTCTPSTNDGYSEIGGWYNCSRSTTSRPKGNYTIDMSSSKSFYQSNSTSKADAFNLGNAPSLTSPSIDHTTGGWGESYTFTVVFSDLDFNQNNLTLWKSYDNSTWSSVSSQAVSGIEVTASVQTRFACTDLLSGPIVYFMFNASDEFGFTAQSPILN